MGYIPYPGVRGRVRIPYPSFKLCVSPYPHPYPYPIFQSPRTRTRTCTKCFRSTRTRTRTRTKFFKATRTRTPIVESNPYPYRACIIWLRTPSFGTESIHLNFMHYRGHHVVRKWKSKGYWIYEHTNILHCKVKCSSSCNITSWRGRIYLVVIINNRLYG